MKFKANGDVDLKACSPEQIKALKEAGLIKSPDVTDELREEMRHNRRLSEAILE